MFDVLHAHMSETQIMAAEHTTGCKATVGHKKFAKCLKAWKEAHPALSVLKFLTCPLNCIESLSEGQEAFYLSVSACVTLCIIRLQCGLVSAAA